MHCFCCDVVLPLDVALDIHTGRGYCPECIMTIKELYLVMYDPRFKDEDAEAIEGMLDDSFDDIQTEDNFHEFNLPVEEE